MGSGTTCEEDISRILFGFAVQAQKQLSDALTRKKKKVIIIAGPTGTGKTDFALYLAKMVGGEVISADAMQVYRGMDVGTAKASLQQRLEVPHHLIDVRDVTEAFNVVDFAYEAKTCCQSILERGNVPIVVGGSGFYLHAFIYGPPAGPSSVPEIRRRLQKEMETIGSDKMYERLHELDPRYAKTITANDKQKIIRALEIIQLTNRKVSQLSWRRREPLKAFDFRCWFTYLPRDVLYPKLDARCEAMLEQGLLDEVTRLDKEGLRTNRSAAQAIGYRQALDFLETDRSADEYDAFMRTFKQASRRYAKRQFTWFRNEPMFRWLDLALHDKEVAADIILEDWRR